MREPTNGLHCGIEQPVGGKRLCFSELQVATAASSGHTPVLFMPINGVVLRELCAGNRELREKGGQREKAVTLVML